MVLWASIQATMTARMTATPGILNTRPRGSRDARGWPAASGTHPRISAATMTPRTDRAPNDQRQSKAVPIQAPSGVPNANPRGAPVDTMANDNPADLGGLMRRP